MAIRDYPMDRTVLSFLKLCRLEADRVGWVSVELAAYGCDGLPLQLLRLFMERWLRRR